MFFFHSFNLNNEKVFFALFININENCYFSNLKRINKEIIKIMIINLIF